MHKKLHLLIFLFCLVQSPLNAQFPETIRLSTLPEPAAIDRKIDSAIKMALPNNVKVELLHQALFNSLQIQYRQGLRNSLHQLMILAYGMRHFGETIGYANLLIAYSNPITHRQQLCEGFLLKGEAYYNREQYVQALDAYYAALSYAPGPRHKAYVFGDLSSIFYNLDQYRKAEAYLDRAIEVDSTYVTVDESILWQKKAALARTRGNTSEANAYFDKAYEAATTADEQATVAFRKTLFLADNLLAKEAMESFERLSPNPDSLTSTGQGLIYLAGGVAYVSNKKYQQALHYLEQTETLKSWLSNSEQRILAHKLSEVYYAMGNYKQAYVLHKQVHKLENRTKTRDITYKVVELETKYRTAQKDIALAKQEAQLSKNREQLYENRLLSFTIAGGLGILLLLVGLRYYYLRQKNEKLKSRQAISRLEALIEGEERERTRLSQELHDGVNSSLAATTSFIQMMAYQTPGLSESTSYIKAMELLTSTSVEIRSIAHNLAPHILIQKGLLYAIEEFGHNLFQDSVELSIEASGSESPLPETLKLFLYRITQELLHNIHKHARASSVSVRLALESRICRLSVRDNGIGIPDDEMKSGIGLQNIREKVHAYGGKMQIESSGQTGTDIAIEIPISL